MCEVIASCISYYKLSISYLIFVCNFLSLTNPTYWMPLMKMDSRVKGLQKKHVTEMNDEMSGPNYDNGKHMQKMGNATPGHSQRFWGNERKT